MATKKNATAKVATSVKDATAIATEIIEENAISKAKKTAIKAYFDDYSKILTALWNGLKNEDTAYKALNNVIAGIAGGENTTPANWLVLHYSKFVDKNGLPCNRYKDESGKEFYKLAKLTGATARGILKKCAINCIESQRKGNRFTQVEVVPIVKK